MIACWVYPLTVIIAFVALLLDTLDSQVRTNNVLLANSSTAQLPSVQEYYATLESRLGYWLLMGNARHCGYWKAGTLWPFPIGRAQRAMEEKLYHRLGLPRGSTVLDAGAGSGYVASYMAKRGLVIEGVDLTPSHVEDARRVIEKQGLTGQVHITEGDYHDLSGFKSSSLDGVYTMETFVHADDPRRVLDNFYRILRPGGVVVLHEVDFSYDSEALQEILRLCHCPNTLKEGALGDMLLEAGFIDITIEDYTDNVLPLWRLFGTAGALPYTFMRLFGLQSKVVNAMAGVYVYRTWGQGRYISAKAIKPQKTDGD